MKTVGRIAVALAVTLGGVVAEGYTTDSVVSASGSPDVQLAKAMPAEVLYGDPIGVTLTATQTSGPNGYNLSFNDTLPLGAIFGSSDPAPSHMLPQGDGTTVLVWENVADLLTGAAVQLSYDFTVDDSVFDIGDSVTNSAGAYANSDPRTIPDFDPSTGAATGDFTGSATATGSTLLIPFEITKVEPSEESELLRGVHDHKTVYTLTVDNNKLIDSTDFVLVDYLPAGIEYLGCIAEDNSTAGTFEYTGTSAGANRRIDATPHPALGNPCIDPTSVTTVTEDPDGAVGPMPFDVYTQLTWTSATISTVLGSSGLLAAGTFSIDYAAAIPLRENVQATLGDPTANLDNNTGALTADDEAWTNYAEVTGTTDGTGYSDDDTATVIAEDISIHKNVDTEVFVHGTNATWTLVVESSEYLLSTDTVITVTDSIPNGSSYVSSTPFALSSGPTNETDGTQTVAWEIPAYTAPNETTTISLVTQADTDYRSPLTGPVAANDDWTNTVDLATDATIITDPTGSTTSAMPLLDESSASQSAQPVTISKEVSKPVAGTLTCGDGALPVEWEPDVAYDYRANDRVCWRLTVNFPGSLDTLSPNVKDFLPPGYSFESWLFGANHNLGSAITYASTTDDEAAGVLIWDLADVDPAGNTFEVVVSSRISDASALANADITTNLLKFSFVNTNDSLFQLRTAADARFVKPVLAATKTSTPTTPVVGGDAVAYTVTFTNDGFLSADLATVVDTLPDGILCAAVSLAGSATCADNGAAPSTLTWTGVNVPAATEVAPVGSGTVDTAGEAVLTYTVTIPVTFDPSAQLDNSVTMTSYQTQTNTGDGPETFTDGPTANASIDITDALFTKARTTSVNETGNNAASDVAIGETITYTLTATIPEGTTTRGAAMTDVMPAGVRLDSAVATINGGAIAPSTLASTAAGFTLTMENPYVNAIGSGSDVVQVVVTATVTDIAGNVAGTNRRNDANFSWAEGSIDRDVLNVVVEPVLAVAKASNDADGIVNPGQEVQYTVTTTNTGSVAHDVVVVDTLPDDLIPLVGPAGADVADGGTVASGGQWDLGARTITWTISSVSASPASGVARVYQTRVQNPLTGASQLKNSVAVTGTSLAGTDVDERTTYSAATDLTVEAPVIKVTSKVANVSTATVGDLVQYTVGVEIPSGIIASDLTVLDVLPAGLAFESLVSAACAEPGPVACTPVRSATALSSSGDTGTIGFFVGDLVTASGETQTLTLVYTARVLDDATNVIAPANLDNEARSYFNLTDKISGTPAGPPAASTFDSESDPQLAEVDVVEPQLVIDKDVVGQTADTDTRRAQPGDVLTYTVAITNSGTSPAHDVVVSDTPDPRLTGYSAPAVAGVVNTDADPVDGTLGWTIAGPIAASSSVTITYSLTVPNTLDETSEIAGFEVTNTADVPQYFGASTATRSANPTVAYRTYGAGAYDVPADTVNVELDLASIGDRVWYDIDGDGVQDSGEPGLVGVGVTVTYLGANGAVGGGDDEVFTAITVANGEWLVDELPGGNYVVDVDASDVPVGLSPSYDLDDGTTSPDGDWIGALAENDAKRDVDAGFTGTGSIGDTIWLDRDASGTQNGDESGIADVAVTVTWAGPNGTLGDPDDVVYTTTTDDDGKYLVDDLPAGLFRVAVTELSLPLGATITSDVVNGTTTPSSTVEVNLGAGANRDDVDFGYRGDSSIGDTIYLDRNADGDQDTPGDNSDEPGLAGVTVQLTWFGPDGALGGGDDGVYTTTTANDGTYSFGGLPAGEYAVDVLTSSLPAALTNTDDEDADNDSNTPVTLAVSDAHDTADFGYVGAATIGDTVYLDLDGNGSQGAGEPGVPGQTVTLNFEGPDGTLGTTDDFVLVTVTDSTGNYSFDNLPDGDYRVTVVGGIVPTATNTGDPDGGTGDRADVTIASGVDDLTQDFGYQGANGLGDTVWWDTNRDGVVDAAVDEPRLAGVDVRITFAGVNGTLGDADDIVISTETTDAAGDYGVTGLPDGSYRVDVIGGVPAGMDNTFDADDGITAPDASSDVALSGGTTDNGQDFGYAGTGSIGDVVYFDRNGSGTRGTVVDEPGIAGVELTLTFAGANGTLGDLDDIVIVQTAGADGDYDFVGLPAGPYTVAVTDGLPSGAINSDDPDLTGAAPDVGDRISSVALTAGEDNNAQDFGFDVDAGLGDRVWWDFNRDGVQDPNEPGVDGVTVTVTFFGGDGVVGGVDDEVFTSVTSGGGDWSVTDIPEGNYSIAITAGVPAGFDNTYDADSGTAGPDGTTGLTAHSGFNVAQDFGIAGNSSIGDTVWLDLDADGTVNGEEVGLADVDVVLTWAGPNGMLGDTDDQSFTTKTDANGGYLFDGLPAGEFEVKVSPTSLPDGLAPTFDRDGTTATPDGMTLVSLLAATDIDDVDFGYRSMSSIGDTIFHDRDRDGVRDVGGDGDEPGIAGVTVRLTWAGEDGLLGTTDDEVFTDVTGADGSYSFDGIPAGEYIVNVDGITLPVGMDNTVDEDGDNNGSTPVTLGVADVHDTADFGYAGVASIGDTIYLDLDGDGAQGANEPGVAGQVVTLSGPTGTFTTTTGADGSYSFDNLPDGAYTVTVTGGVVGAANNTADPDNAVGAGDNTASLTIAGGVSNDAQDFGYQGTAGLGDTLFLDADADGVDDGAATEPRLDGVDVVVTWLGPDGSVGGGDDVVIPVAPTDVNGVYGATGLPTGAYTVAPEIADVPAGLVISVDPDDGAAADGNTPNGSAVVTLADGETNNDQDFGYAGTGSIGNTVWLDLDSDGVRDAGEPGIQGATVTLTWFGPDGVAGGTDDVVSATTVADDGNYLFENLPAGNFEVAVSGLPGGLDVTADPDGGGDSTASVTLAPGAADLDQSFGYVGTASVGDTVFLDFDGDGAQDLAGNVGTTTTEPGVPGVTVTVTSAGVDGVLGTADDLTFTTTTDSDGTYSVPGVPAGPTQVSIDTTASLPDVTPQSDSDTAPGATGNPATSTINLADGENNTDQDFAVAGPGTISGVVVDSGNPGLNGIPNVPVTITYTPVGGGDPIVIITTTGPDGSYSVPGVPTGDYTVEVVENDHPTGFIPNGPTSTQVTVTATDSTPSSVDFPFVMPGSIGQRVFFDVNRNGVQDPNETGTPGVSVQLLDSNGNVIATVVTDADGDFLFPDLVPGTYTVVLDPSTFPPGVVLSTDPDGTIDLRYTVTIGPGENVRTAIFGLSSPVLPQTGQSAVRSILSIAMLLLMLGVALLVSRRRRNVQILKI